MTQVRNNPFDLTSIKRGDEITPRCRHLAGLCHNASQHDDDLCNYHQARALHEQHSSVADPGCLFCPARPGELSRLTEDRLQELGDLPDGWYDGDGRAPSVVSLAAARELLAAAPFELAAGLQAFPSMEAALCVENSPVADADWFNADIEDDGQLVLFSPWRPADENDPAFNDGMVFTDAPALWAYVAVARAELSRPAPPAVE